MITHNRLQQECWLWHYNTYPEDRPYLRLLYSNPRNKIQGSQLKSMGFKKGMPDAVWFRPFPLSAIYFEFKVGKDKLSQDQVDTHMMLESSGANVCVIRKFDDYKYVVLTIK